MHGETDGVRQHPRTFPADASQYQLLQEIGRGSSAIVWRARCIPLNEEVAIKLVDLELFSSSMDEIRVCFSPHGDDMASMSIIEGDPNHVLLQPPQCGSLPRSVCT